MSENTEREGRCRAGQRSLHGLKILIDRTRRKQDPAPSFVRSGTCFHSNQAGRQETEQWGGGCLQSGVLGPFTETVEVGFVAKGPETGGGLEKRLREL